MIAAISMISARKAVTGSRSRASASPADPRDCIRETGDPAGIPGLLSMYLLREKDGTRVTNYMHWGSRQAFQQATSSDPVIAATKRAIRRFTDAPLPYEVIEVK
jgi:heme-degrading monooxygenase HmoA